MRFLDELRTVPPPPPPRVPKMPFTIVELPYGVGPLQRIHKTVIRGTLVGEVVDEDHELYRAWEYVCALEAKVRELTVALETAPLLGPGPVPAEVPTAPTDPQTSAEPVQTAANECDPPTATNNPVPPEEPADKRTRAVAALLADPGASNYALGERAGCSGEYIRITRHQLTAEGRLAAPAKGASPANTELVPETVVGGAPLAGADAE